MYIDFGRVFLFTPLHFTQEFCHQSSFEPSGQASEHYEYNGHLVGGSWVAPYGDMRRMSVRVSSGSLKHLWHGIYFEQRLNRQVLLHH